MWIAPIGEADCHLLEEMVAIQPLGSPRCGTDERQRLAGSERFSMAALRTRGDEYKGGIIRFPKRSGCSGDPYGFLFEAGGQTCRQLSDRRQAVSFGRVGPKGSSGCLKQAVTVVVNERFHSANRHFPAMDKHAG